MENLNQRLMKLGSAVALFLSMNVADEAAETVENLGKSCKDEHQRQIIYDVAVLLREFAKEQKPTEGACVNNQAAQDIEELQNGDEYYNLQKENIANSLSAIAEMICCGRDSEDIAVHTDELLQTMRTIAEYNTLLDKVSATSDHTAGRFIYRMPNAHGN